MNLSVETQIRQHLQANDAIQDPIDFEEIVSRLADDPRFARSQGVDAPSAWSMPPFVTRGIVVAAAAAVITLLLLGLIPLWSGGEQIPPADTAPQPVPPTNPVQETTGDTEPQAGEDATAAMVFTAVPSDPVTVEGSLTWRTVELPADGPLRVGLDDRIYLLTEDVVWVSDNGVDWTGHPVEQPLPGFLLAVGRDRLISAGGGGWLGGKQFPIPSRVAIYDLPHDDSGELRLVAVSELPVPEVDNTHSVAIGPHGALVTSGGVTSGDVFYSQDGDRWTPVEGLPNSDGMEATATGEGFYVDNFYSADGVEWIQIGEAGYSDRGGVWGDDVLTLDTFQIWRLTPQGAENLYTSGHAIDDWVGGVAGSELGVLAVGLDLGSVPDVEDGRGYLYSPDGVKWEEGTLPDGWAVTDEFVEQPIAMNDETILVIASRLESENGNVFDGNLALMATP